TADSLLQAATRLEKDVRRETNYWQQVMSVSEKGWSVCRLPQEKHNLGVRFGFSEATREFKDRGLAALRADEEGNIILDQGLASKATSLLQTLGFDTKFSITSTAPSLAGFSRAASGASGDTSTSAVEALIAALTSPLESEATLALPAPADQPLRFQLRTFVDTPTYGSEYRLTAPAALTPDAPNETEFPRFADLVAHVHYLLSMSLVHCVTAAHPGWTARAREAEAFTAGRGLERKRGIGVVVGGGKVVLRDGGSGWRYEWGGRQGGEDRKTFMEVVAEAVDGNPKLGQSREMAIPSS
ncbi:hypothetical protein B0A49_10491, partial [Cryomyces minteri]